MAGAAALLELAGARTVPPDRPALPLGRIARAFAAAAIGLIAVALIVALP